jgi:dTDP-4-amino-4,6-dideoxygalactose transaminase
LKLFGEAGVGDLAPFEPDWAKAVYHLYVLRVKDRDGLMRYLATSKIGTGIHYPVPLHMQKAYAHLNHKVGDFPVAERVAPEVISVPMFPSIAPVQQSAIVERILEYFPRVFLPAAGLAGAAVATPVGKEC